jgi:hypothetical protein
MVDELPYAQDAPFAEVEDATSRRRGPRTTRLPDYGVGNPRDDAISNRSDLLGLDPRLDPRLSIVLDVAAKTSCP